MEGGDGKEHIETKMGFRESSVPSTKIEGKKLGQELCCPDWS